MAALEKQVDGNHYKLMRMQPIELTYMIGGTPCFCKLAKYGSRIKESRIRDLEKAKHCIELEAEFEQSNFAIVGEFYKSWENIVIRQLANNLINFFTEDELLRVALKAMYEKQYNLAIANVEKMIEREANAG